MTWSPTRTPVTPSPSASTVPATSMPGVCGGGATGMGPLHAAAADAGVDGVERRRRDPEQHLPGTGDGLLGVLVAQDGGVAVVVERGTTVTITGAGRALLADVMPGHTEVVSHLLFEPLPSAGAETLAALLGAGARPHALDAAAPGRAPPPPGHPARPLIRKGPGRGTTPGRTHTRCAQPG